MISKVSLSSPKHPVYRKPLGTRQKAAKRHLSGFRVADKLAELSRAPLEKLLVVGEPTGMMASDKKGESFFPGIEFRPTRILI